MISPRFYIFLVFFMLIMYASSIEYTGSLTSSECRACKSKKTTQMKDDFDFVFFIV